MSTNTPQFCKGRTGYTVFPKTGEPMHTMTMVVERLGLPSPFGSQQGWSSWMVNSD